MPRYVRPFKIQLPVVTLPVTHGAQPAIVLLSMTQPGDKNPQFVYATCIDIDGRGHQHVPLHMNIIREAAINPMTFVETDDRIVAPTGGLIVPGTR